MSNYDSDEMLKLSFAKPLNIKICTNPNYAEDTNIYSQQPQQVQYTPASQPQSVQKYSQLQQYPPYAIPGAAAPAYSARKSSAAESVPTCDVIIGEQLCSNILSNIMYTMSSKNVHNRHRKVCDGVIKDCKIIRYYSDGKCLNHYILTTVGADFQRYSFHICQSEFEDKQLTNILTDKGRLHFYRQRRDIYECELIQKYILSIAEKSDDEYPEFTGWKNGKYIAAAEVIDIDTPFFKHICRSGSMSQKDAAEGILNNLNILKKDKHRLFFLLLLHYIALRQLIPAELRQPSPFYIYSDTDLTYVADALLGIFGTNEIIPLSDTKGKIIKALSFAEGTSVFFNIPEYSYAYSRRVGENTEYLNSLSDPKTTVIVLCRTYDRYTESAFNITLNKDDISKQYVNKSACGEHIRHFTDWISERSIDFSNNPSDNFLTLIFGLVSEYFTEIGVSPELENPCALIDELIDESSMDLTGAWVIEWFAKSCLTLRSKGMLNIVDLSSNTGSTEAGSSFDNNLPTVIKKDHLLCITESDLSRFIKLCDTNLSACIVKQSLLNMGALDRDKGRTYQKNIYIPQLNKAKRMLAIIYSLIFPSGHLGI